MRDYHEICRMIKGYLSEGTSENVLVEKELGQGSRGKAVWHSLT